MISVREHEREVSTRLNRLEDGFRVLGPKVEESVKARGWSKTVTDLVYLDKGLSIPQWQDIGCSVNFEADGNISVVSIGCSMMRMYAYSTLHYEIRDAGSGSVVVQADPSRLANNSYGVVSASQTSVGRLFAHMLAPGVYSARLLVRTQHANTDNWDATLNVYSASIAVRNY